ncbi:TPA: 50S ribosomal protein L35 [Candidatus Dependentiae bacterium]|nr:MAG: 50S ribosomal protein L35 [candidate division TM6 bacterium GW2011_GWF2_36_131]KKQ03186.1 MAG: 50S ribosomal protein L35 [candidate division TM6 bacterium GW2011_GWE2_36_25]KKQ18544.1 MAG: 50S ribosomal protein L35 [candidate division TM6 bacterium GW2011_GWA2_36_9]HBR70384.1 50S ribosomal protein L35 [Candidatus Dependentiae bacterium]HCU00929.1 50S ribosomal protein L35 [Candidatus Dependentiae bacterium]
MPKMKTHSAAKKRFKKTAKGKIKRQHAYKRHLMASKTSKRKRHLRHADYMASGDAQRIERLLPYL